MKLRWKILLVVLVVFAICGALMLFSGGGKRRAVAETRRQLREQGFKTELSEFDFSITPEMQRREQALTNFYSVWRGGSQQDYRRYSLLEQLNMDTMEAMGKDAAFVQWKETRWLGDSGEDLWPMLRDVITEQQGSLDAACESALSGPIRFGLNAGHGSAMLLRHAPTMKSLAQSFAKRAMVSLHDGKASETWTNLLASTRLVTAWEVEPVEVSTLVWFACASIVFNTTWQVLQTNAWSDDQLRELQQAWESVDYFKGLPETVAFARAGYAANCQQERKQAIALGETLGQIVRAPRYAWPALKYFTQRLRYQFSGSYETEKDLLLYYRDREVEMRNAIKSQSWSEMRDLPGVTNLPVFQAKQTSQLQSLMNMRQISMGYAFAREGGTTLGRAAESEARRRVVITAIALERYRGKYGSYPAQLQELVPKFLKTPLIDFIDGKPLRYRLADDGHFVLWSVGLDGIDNGGQLAQRRRQQYEPFNESEEAGGRRQRRPSDLVWPRPAGSAEVRDVRKKQQEMLSERVDREEEQQAFAEWEFTARRQEQVEKILAKKPARKTVDPKYHGKLLSEVLQNKSATGTNKLTLDEMLTLKQVTTGTEPEIVTFETPIAFDVLTNIGELALSVDPAMDRDSDEGCSALMLECKRAANGNCLLVWNTIFETPGKHALQLGLQMNEPKFAWNLEKGRKLSEEDMLKQYSDTDDELVGPMSSFVVSNICQFSTASAHFNPEFGGTTRAQLPEDVADYIMELKTADGTKVRTITGATTNGMIKVFWDLKDDQGRRCTNNYYDTVFRITLPASGRTQTQRGP